MSDLQGRPPQNVKTSSYHLSVRAEVPQNTSAACRLHRHLKYEGKKIVSQRFSILKENLFFVLPSATVSIVAFWLFAGLTA